MKRVTVLLTTIGALLGGVVGSSWALDLQYLGWNDDVTVYEYPVTYDAYDWNGQRTHGLDYVVKNEGSDYIWGLVVGLKEDYPVSYPMAVEDIFTGDDWWGWDYWESLVFSSEALADEIAGAFSIAFEDLTDEEFDQIYDFVVDNITPLFSDYPYVYFTYQASSNAYVEEITVEDNPIVPGSTASGFGVMTYGLVIPASPVAYISTSNSDPDKNSTWNFTHNESVLVPEPSSGLLLLVGVLGLGSLRRRR